MVYHHVLCTEKFITKLLMTNDLLQSVKLAHLKDTTTLEEKKSKLKEGEKDQKRKLKLEEIAEIKVKKRVLESCMESLESNIEKYSIYAEEKSDLSLLTMVLEKKNINSGKCTF